MKNALICTIAAMALALSACGERVTDDGPVIVKPDPQKPGVETVGSVTLPEKSWWEPIKATIGVPACDAYFERFAVCKKMPPRASAEIRRAIAKWRWRLESGGAAAEKGITSSCTQSAQIWAQALANVGC